ncbi:DNA repair protein [Trypanosoma grayi]|uniref:DNA repair protein n=1 Tax=Trypanosoma grayi TaxID=71804 RepID=UPI0004F4AF60|nr:DNA repair protein [Trypanosoma grayi]KEG09096.1 DNA repair protein [Trypanosoma grayi]
MDNSNSQSHNEQLALHVEHTWPNRFPVFCGVLRRHPLPITCGAAATALQGSCTDAVLAVDAYLSGKNRGGQPPPLEDGEIQLFPRLELPRRDHGVTMAVSPFRCFKMRRVEAGTSLLWRAESTGSASDDADILLTLLDSSHQKRVNGHARRASPPVTRRAEDDRPVEERLGMKELRVRCASMGLLTNGTKKDLIARLRQHNSLQPSGPPSELLRTGEQPQQEQQQRQQKQKQQTSGMMIGDALSAATKRYGLTNEEQFEYSQRLRTPFRSPSATSQSPSPPPAEQQQQQPPRRLLGTPQEFVDALVQRNKRGGRTARAAAFASATNDTTCSSWRLLVDNRERIRGTHDHVIEAFTAAGVPTVSCALPCGDFMIGIDAPCGTSVQPMGGEGSNSFSASSIFAEGSGGQAQRIFSVVVERKTVKDLCASIATPRYYEQRRLLSASPFRSVVWVVEGTTQQLRPEEHRRVLSACASLAAVPRFCVVRTRHLAETIVWLRSLAAAYVTALTPTTVGIGKRPLLADSTACMRHVAELRRELRARTTFPRVLMCIRGCSSGLAVQLARKYGSLLNLWRRLKNQGREACDADMDIRRLTTTQRDVYVRLTELLLAEEYY